jgi:hypothetical protein
MDNIQNAFGYIERQRAVLDDAEQVLFSLCLSELPVCCTRVWISGDNDINFDIPFDPTKLSAIRRYMGRGWKFEWQSGPESVGNLYRRYKNPAFPLARICICMYPDHKGATCRRVQVGERLEPIYKIVCD